MKGAPRGVVSSVRIVRRCMSYLRPYWKITALSYAVVLISTGISVFQPIVIREIIDEGIRGKTVHIIVAGVLLLVGLTAVRGLFTYLSGRWTEIASQGVAYDLRNLIHKKLQSLSFSYHDRAESGQLIGRAISDVDRIRFLTGRALLRLLTAVTLVIGVAAAMFAMNARLALLTLAVVPFMAYSAFRFGRRLRPVSREVQQKEAVLTGQLEQNLRGARTVKAFGQEEAEMERFRARNTELFENQMISARLGALFSPLMDLLASIGTLFILVYGGSLVMRSQLTIGELVAFFTYVGQLMVPVRQFGWVITAVSQSAASGERVFEILDAASDVTDSPDAKPIGRVEGRVAFESVSFAHTKDYWVLRGVDFLVNPGEKVALLGPTGSGKSSIISLIPRFYDPTEGRVRIDGRDLRGVTLASLRDAIGIVMQDTVLFSTTIRENIAFGRPGATDREVEQAARAARAHDFISELAGGYAARVGERGVTLSGGQRQRISIARALLKDPRIIILDDATSSVDTETERLIQEALALLMEGRTSFVIAQRLSTVRQADVVLVLDRGRVAALARRTNGSSPHEQLLRTSEIYFNIYQQQLRPTGENANPPAGGRGEERR
ncbi:MAG TPA: ABC transporter ATP-binding protein [Spirochaetia bacterium]|nr:ABC transporter ATP-binding protein [Spirochaetia bacterium]